MNTMVSGCQWMFMDVYGRYIYIYRTSVHGVDISQRRTLWGNWLQTATKKRVTLIEID